MAKLLNKKERVFDLKLTGYGKYLMSVGRYKPQYYAFFDDNIVYDNKYTKTGSALTSPLSESQNSINARIKEETPYISTLTLFEDINVTSQRLTRQRLDDVTLLHPDERRAAEGFAYTFKQAKNYYSADVTPTMYTPRADSFKFEAAIGDALLDSKETNVAPAWKVVVLNGTITTSAPKFSSSLTPSSSINIPQINIRVDYQKQIRSSQYPTRQSDQIADNTVRGSQNRTPNFVDENFIRLKSQDPIIYVDEVNTELLTENFDIEVFLITTGSHLERKYFETAEPQVVDGMMTRAQPAATRPEGILPETAVEYYFDVKQDAMADPDIVCKQLQVYNKSSYYIDLDIDCAPDDEQDIYNDIYGSEVEPEICLD
ncbi:MAG: hypothetical protein CMI60_23210 [Parvibaculum sp.]|jgi:hypothetical protein|nr:hypothetical protein [Parvibaculum sp.]